MDAVSTTSEKANDFEFRDIYLEKSESVPWADSNGEKDSERGDYLQLSQE